MAVQVPLKILITDGSLLAQDVIKEQIDKLEKVGHTVVIDETLKQFDFICGPNCWLLRPEVANLFTMAVTNARKVANADQERVDQVKLATARKRTAKATSKTSRRKRQVEGVSPAAGSDTVNQTSFIEGDSSGEQINVVE